MHLRPDQQSLPQTILSVYVGLEAGGLRSLLLGSICRIRVAATFKTHPETADELQELASTKGRISNCSWSVMVPPRTAMVTLDYAELPVLQQRRKFLDTLQARTLEDKPAIDPSHSVTGQRVFGFQSQVVVWVLTASGIEEPGPVTVPPHSLALRDCVCTRLPQLQQPQPRLTCERNVLTRVSGNKQPRILVTSICFQFCMAEML